MAERHASEYRRQMVDLVCTGRAGHGVMLRERMRWQARTCSQHGRGRDP